MTQVAISVIAAGLSASARAWITQNGIQKGETATIQLQGTKTQGVVGNRLASFNGVLIDLPSGQYDFHFQYHVRSNTGQAGSGIVESPTGILVQISTSKLRDFARVESFTVPDIAGTIIKPIAPDIEQPVPEEEAFIFANIFRMQGTPPVKVLVSSGRISQASADVLEASGHIIEIISEGEVAPPDIAPVTPQNPFYIKNGKKVFINQQEAGRVLRIEIKETLGFRET